MGTGVLGDNIRGALDALSDEDKADRTLTMRAMGNEIEDWSQPISGWSSSVTYAIDFVVAYSGSIYVSLQNGNLNKVPSSEPSWWSPVAGGNPFNQDLNTTDNVAFAQITGPLVGNAATADLADAVGGAQATAIAANTVARHAESHNVASHSDTTATGAELETLTNGSDADALHDHDVADAHVIGDGSDHSDVAANTAASHAEAHSVASHDDTTATGAELETLTDGSDADALHSHAVADVHVAGDGSDHSDVAANTIKVGTQTATGDWDDYHTTGFYNGSSLANECPGSSWRYCLVIHHSSNPVDWVSQTMMDFSGTGMYQRNLVNSVWGVWRQLDIDSYTKTEADGLNTTQNTAIGLNTTHRGSVGTDHEDVGFNNTHRGASNNPHSVSRADLNVNTDDEVVFLGLSITEDNDTNDHAYMAMVLHGTDDTPPAASGFPRGTIYIKYTP